MALLDVSSFEKAQTILHRSLGAQMLRWNTLSNNIANVNTPNYKRSDVTFAAQMRRALDSETQIEPFAATKTHSDHFDFETPINYRTVEPKLQTEFYTAVNNNGNNVDSSFEMGESLKTSLLYNATASLIQRRYSQINDMIK